MLIILFTMWGCGEADQCEEGTIRSGARCAPYAPSDPVPYPGELRLAPGTTWQWQITGEVDTSHDVEVYDIDLFDLTDEVRQQLDDDGRVMICYFSAGSYEPWRDDAGRFPEEAIGRPLDDWPDERWLDTTNPVVREILLDRLDHAVEWRCDGVEFDNVTAHSNRTGFGINATEQLDFNRFLADAAHERGLLAALKNDVDQIPELVDWFDVTVNEECYFYEECGTTRPFLDAGKAVFNAEYVDDWADAEALADEVCGRVEGISTIIKDWDLGPRLVACDRAHRDGG